MNGIIAATQSQTFLGITEDGRASAVTTGGNPDCQLILRGAQPVPIMQLNLFRKLSRSAAKHRGSLLLDG